MKYFGKDIDEWELSFVWYAGTAIGVGLGQLPMVNWKILVGMLLVGVVASLRGMWKTL